MSLNEPTIPSIYIYVIHTHTILISHLKMEGAGQTGHNIYYPDPGVPSVVVVMVCDMLTIACYHINILRPQDAVTVYYRSNLIIF